MTGGGEGCPLKDKVGGVFPDRCWWVDVPNSWWWVGCPLTGVVGGVFPQQVVVGSPDR